MTRVVAAVALIVATTVAPVAPAGAAESEGRIVDFELRAPAAPVRVGDTITWTNDGKRPHTVTDRGALFDTGPILPGASATTTFDTPGTYSVFCEINPSRMNATVVVEPGPTPPERWRIEARDELREGDTRRFVPNDLEVAAGTRIVVANVGGLRHSLAAEGGAFEIAAIEPGAEGGRFAGGNGSVVVDRPGTYPFFCTIHPQAMRGRLVVGAAQVDSGAPPAAPDDDAPRRARATIRDFAFEPANVEVARRGRVTWTNQGDAPHTVTFDDVGLDSGRIEAGRSSTVTAPEQPGTYSFYCALHPARMRGVLSVRLAAGPPPAATAPGSRPDGDDSAGTLFAYGFAAALLATGAAGAGAGMRRRPA